MRNNSSLISLLALVIFSLLFTRVASAEQPALADIAVTLIENDVFFGATFSSNNQKVLKNQHGIFASYLRSRNEAYTAQGWRLIRSTDEGKTFSIIYDATHATNPPIIETDETGNIYLLRPDFSNGNGVLYRFLAENDFQSPEIIEFPNGSAGKFAAYYDLPRKQLYYLPHNGHFFILGLDGSIKSSTLLLTQGTAAVRQYPHLSMDADGNLYAAWTTVKHGEYMYWSIQFIKSIDGGLHWQKLDGTPLSLPIVDDPTGPSQEVTSSDEHNVHTWLSNITVKDGKLHFMYELQILPVPYPERYIRYDIASATEDIYTTPEFRGEKLSISGLDGFFTFDQDRPDSTLYAIGHERLDGASYQSSLRVVCIASDDNGKSWYDYAATQDGFSGLYALGGQRTLTEKGEAIGSFTVAQHKPPQVYFLKFQAGIARASIDKIEHSRDSTNISFSSIRGNPVEVSFKVNNKWKRWITFSKTLRLQYKPSHYMFRSSLKVVSPEYAIVITRE